MAIARRVLLFIIVNVLIIVMINIIMTIFGIHGYLTARGINYKSLAIFCAIWGTGGAFISLLVSKYMAKHGMGVQVIDPKTATGQHADLIRLIYRLAERAGLRKMPEVGIYDSPEMNAFATGPSKNNSLVAVSTGLLANMNRNEVEGVLGHEISHVNNGDMVTMTLIQGIVNSFALFLSRIVAFIIASAMSGERQEGSSSGGGFSNGIFFILTLIFDIAFTLLGSIVIAAYSRWREYRADSGGARLAGKANMISALERLKAGIPLNEEVADNRAPSLSILKISVPKRTIVSLFATHPPIEKRIERLMQQTS